MCAVDEIRPEMADFISDLQEIELPLELVRNSVGIAFDFGGSRCKIAFRKKEPISEIPSPKYAKVTYGLLTVPLDRVHDGIEYVKRNATVIQSSNRPVLHVTGVSVNDSIKAAIELEFNVRVEIGYEFSGLPFIIEQLLSQDHQNGVVGTSSMLHSVSESAEEEWRRARNQLTVEASEFRSATSNSGSQNHLELCEDDGQYLLLCCGSAMTYGVVGRDGQSKVVDGAGRGGISLFTLAHLLTGVKTYEEFISLAEHGEERFVSTLFSEVKSKNNFYNAFPDDLVLFDFGKATAENFQVDRKHIARALLCHVVREIVQLTCWIATANQCRMIYICGGFLDHPLVRDEFYVNFNKHTTFRNMTSLQCRMLKLGRYLPVLGTLINSRCRDPHETHQ